MGSDGENGESRSEPEDGESRPEAEEGESNPTLERSRALAEEEASRLQGGPQLSFFGGTLPVRGLAAMGVFLTVFMLAWVGLWAALGGLGLALGWIPAALVAIAGVVLIGRTLWSSPGRPAGVS